MPQKFYITNMYESMLQIVDEVCKDLGCQYDFIDFHDITENLSLQIRAIFNEQGYPYVIVTRGAMANYLKQEFPDIIILSANPGRMDTLEALAGTGRYGDRVGLLLADNDHLDLNLQFVKDLLNIRELNIYRYASKKDIETQIVLAQSQGMDCVAGGGTIGQDVGHALGYPVVFVKTSKDTIKKTIIQACSILNSKSYEENQLQLLYQIQNAFHEGLMMIHNGRVCLINNTMEQLLGVTTPQVVDKPLSDISSQFTIKDLAAFMEDQEQDECISLVGDSLYFIQKFWITVDEHCRNLVIVIRNAEEIQDSESRLRNKIHKKNTNTSYSFQNIIGSSHKMKETINKAMLYSTVDANILIYGESGTGKELFAQSIHNASQRRSQPFVAVNCAAIPESLLESELFGYEEGSFSGAKKGGKTGLLELAHNGTLFLDEVNSLSMKIQGALLRAVQEKEIRRVGSKTPIYIDIRIISAANKDIGAMIQNNEFRSDLYFRLNILNLYLPNLNEHSEDIPQYIDFFSQMYSRLYKVPVTRKMADEEIRFLVTRKWQGNIRELQNVIHRYIILNSMKITPVRVCLDEYEVKHGPSDNVTDHAHMMIVNKGPLKDMELEIIRGCLAENGGNINRTSEQLGVCRTTIWRKLNQQEGQ